MKIHFQTASADWFVDTADRKYLRVPNSPYAAGNNEPTSYATVFIPDEIELTAGQAMNKSVAAVFYGVDVPDGMVRSGNITSAVSVIE